VLLKNLLALAVQAVQVQVQVAQLQVVQQQEALQVLWAR